MSQIYNTREEWLNAAVTELRAWFKDISVSMPEKIRVSCAWTKRPTKGAIAWCWKSEASGDGTTEIQLTPEIANPVSILESLTHELIHASDNGASKHAGHFRATAKKIGLAGKMTATHAGDQLLDQLTALAGTLGEYPHAPLNPNAAASDKPKQSTRMLKASCKMDGYTVRLTKKWVEVGLPYCPCGMEMDLEDKENSEDD